MERQLLVNENDLLDICLGNTDVDTQCKVSHFTLEDVQVIILMKNLTLVPSKI